MQTFNILISGKRGVLLKLPLCTFTFSASIQLLATAPGETHTAVLKLLEHFYMPCRVV